MNGAIPQLAPIRLHGVGLS